jgi:CrcB protein
MRPWVVVAAIAAGAIGALARYVVTLAVEARLGRERLPRAVLIVNIAGSLVAGLVIGATHASLPELTYVLVGGFAGGLTTFSTWTVETIQLAAEGRTGAAIRNALVNLVAGGVAVYLGFIGATWIASLLWQAR